MTEGSSADLLTLFDSAPLNWRYWRSFSLIAAGSMLDLFDFFIVGYLVAQLGPQWHLTYGQSAIILLSGGVGAIISAPIWGSLSDTWGRKRQLVAGYLICAFGAGMISLIPDHAWVLFAALRFVVGFGLSAASVPALTMIVEITPTRFRTVVASLAVVFPTVGTLLSSLTAATLLSILGWRGVAALGAAPALVAVLASLLIPELVRWLIAKGRFAEAQALVARHLGLPLARVPLPNVRPVNPPRGRLADLYAQPRLFWLVVFTMGGAATVDYAVILWGPTIFSLLLKITVAQAARYFVFVILCGIAGKIGFSLLPQWWGRRRCGQLHGFGLAVDDRRGRLFPRHLRRRVSALRPVADGHQFVHGRRLHQSRPVHDRGVRRPPRGPRRGSHPGVERLRQDPRSGLLGGHRRRRQPVDPARDRGRDLPGLHVPGCVRPGDRLGLHLPRAGDARPAARDGG